MPAPDTEGEASGVFPLSRAMCRIAAFACACLFLVNVAVTGGRA